MALPLFVFAIWFFSNEPSISYPGYWVVSARGKFGILTVVLSSVVFDLVATIALAAQHRPILRPTASRDETEESSPWIPPELRRWYSAAAIAAIACMVAVVCWAPVGVKSGLLRSSLRHRSSSWAWYSLRLLNSMNRESPCARRELESCLQNPDALVRLHAAYALQHHGSEVVSTFLTVTRHHDRELREFATNFLVKYPEHSESTVPGLIEMLQQNNDVLVQSAAISSLGALGPKASSARPVLLELLESDARGRPLFDFAVRRQAAIALGKMGAPIEEALPALMNAIKHDALTVAIGAAAGIGELGPAAKDAIPLLTEFLDSGDALALESAFAVCRIGGDHARTCLPLLLGTLDDQSWGNMAGLEVATQALARLGPAARPALPKLMRLVEESSTFETVRVFAAFAVARIDPERAEFAVSVLAELAERASSQGFESRQLAVQRLGDLGHSAKAAIPVLQSIRDSEMRRVSFVDLSGSSELRRSITIALCRIEGNSDQPGQQ